MKIGRWLMSAVTVVLVLTGCTKPLPPAIEKTWLTMGTFASITLPSAESNQLDACISETTRCFEGLDRAFSVYLPESEISKLNSSTGMIAVGWDALLALQETIQYSELTGGAFDPTVAPLVRTWGFSGGSRPTELPSAELIAEVLAETGYTNLTFDVPSAGVMRAGFSRPGMSVDLGGFAKGFAVDRAYKLLAKRAPINALINLGGNIRCLGAATPKRPWRIGVRNPFDGTQMLGSVTLDSGMAVATSGNYERFVMIDGKRYAHIIDPRTGYPVQGMAGVTVVSPLATEADVMSTALFVEGVESASELLANLPKSHALLVPDRQPIEIWVSPGFKERFTPLPQYKESVRMLPGTE
jgi:thiamine biosynthesis lipoprotein